MLDDRDGSASFSADTLAVAAAQGRQLLDVSRTPNRLLQAQLQLQAISTPSIITLQGQEAGASTDASVAGPGGPAQPPMIGVVLAQPPIAAVAIDVVVPPAWDGSTLAEAIPPTLYFGPSNFSISQMLVLAPRPCMAVGNFSRRLELG